MKKKILHELIPIDNKIPLLERQISYQKLIFSIKKSREMFFDILTSVGKIEIDIFQINMDRFKYLKKNSKLGTYEYIDIFRAAELFSDEPSEIIKAIQTKIGKVSGGTISKYPKLDPKTSEEYSTYFVTIEYYLYDDFVYRGLSTEEAMEKGEKLSNLTEEDFMVNANNRDFDRFYLINFTEEDLNIIKEKMEKCWAIVFSSRIA